MRSTEAPARPTTLSLAVLGLLSERPMHPYEIAFLMRKRGLVDTIRLKLGSLYHSVQALQATGLISPVETAREGRRPERTVYAITRAGSDVFDGALRGLIREPVREYNEFEAGLCFIGQMDRSEALTLLEERAATVESHIRHHRELIASVMARGVERLSLVEHEHALALEAAELEWIQTLCADVRSGRMPWKHCRTAEFEEGDSA